MVDITIRLTSRVTCFQEFPEPLALDEFVLNHVEDAMRSCETTDDSGLVYCDLKVLAIGGVFVSVDSVKRVPFQALSDLLQANVSALQGNDDVERRARASRDVEVRSVIFNSSSH